MAAKSRNSKRMTIPFPFGRRTVGRYELLFPLASGGMASVFLGRLSGMAGFEKLVAIKIIHPHLIEQEEFVEMFLDEARLSAQIHHPNVVEIFEVGEEDGVYFMVAELVRGQSLKDLLGAMTRLGKRVEPRIFLSIMVQVCEALHAAHTLDAADGSPLGLVHRDVSPSNILISYDGFVKLIDFGIAFAEGRITSTRSGVVKGKFGFMAPEQLKGNAIDRRSDIFSLGVVLYLMASGKHPFKGNTEGEQVNLVLNTEPMSLCEIDANISPDLERVILKALAKNPEHRHQTAEKLGLELRSLLTKEGGSVESMRIAELMTTAFAVEKEEDKLALDKAVSLAPIEPGSSGAREIRSTTPTPGAWRLTDVIQKPFQRTSGRWFRGVLLFLIVVFGAVVGHVVYNDSGAGWTDAVERDVGARLGLNGKGPEYGADENQMNGQQLALGDGGDSSADGSSLGVIDSLLQASQVKLQLQGLPDSPTVLLDGEETAVDGDTIAVPSDGQKRELKVIADGYEAYLETISPVEDGVHTITMRKKRGQPSKAGQNKKRNRKPKRDKLMECPYCD